MNKDLILKQYKDMAKIVKDKPHLKQTQDKTPERSDCKTVCPYLFSFKRVEKTFSTGVLPKYRMFQEHYGHIPLICLVFSAM